ncbi:DNA breaking-rejoining enzyme [Flammula alnicola]|nr:DNA breaking-rejoining enzyme [Flammula alnicola]
MSSLRKRKAGTERERFNTTIALNTASSKSRPAPYAKDLQPLPSAHRPHVLARERLRLWLPLNRRNTLDASGTPTNLAPADLQRIQEVLENAWAESTRESYGTGLLIYHVFCDRKVISEQQKAPASPILIASFIATIAGAYSGKSISNYVYGVRAWHILHGINWNVDDAEITTLLKAAEKATPASSKRKKRTPYTPDFISAIRSKLDLNNPLHAAVYACLTTSFYSAARLGEFTVRRLDAFNPAIHVKPSDVRDDQDRNGLKSTVFHIPRTKTAINGEDVSWSMQHGDTDPEAAFHKHTEVNQPPREGPLFAYRHKNTHRPLTKTKFLEVVRKAAKEAGLEPRQGHGIRIGATLEYLLRGVPFDVMKTKGRWASDAFIGYLTKHAQILAPYMQAVPELHDSFIRLTMPPPR